MGIYHVIWDICSLILEISRDKYSHQGLFECAELIMPLKHYFYVLVLENKSRGMVFITHNGILKMFPMILLARYQFLGPRTEFDDQISPLIDELCIC